MDICQSPCVPQMIRQATTKKCKEQTWFGTHISGKDDFSFLLIWNDARCSCPIEQPIHWSDQANYSEFVKKSAESCGQGFGYRKREIAYPNETVSSFGFLISTWEKCWGGNFHTSYQDWKAHHKIDINHFRTQEKGSHVQGMWYVVRFYHKDMRTTRKRTYHHSFWFLNIMRILKV